jgi:hypothetical protein
VATKKRRNAGGASGVRTGPLATDPYDVQIFMRHQDDDASRSVPWKAEIATWPKQARARIRSIITTVAAAPPTRFSGGGMWEAMRGEMGGFCEARCRYGGKLYRAFCILDPDPVMEAASGRHHGKNVLVIISAGCKKNKTAFKENFYNEVRGLRDEYLRRTPRSWSEATPQNGDGEE